MGGMTGSFVYLMVLCAGTCEALRRGRKIYRQWVLAGFILLVLQRSFTSAPHLTTNSGDQRLINRLVPEQDGAMLAAWALSLGAIGDDAFLPAIESGYQRFSSQVPGATAATPAIATYLGMQSSETFDLVEFNVEQQSKRVVIFLHGYAGNFAMQCWHFANAVKEIPTYCPSVGPRGYWKDRQGYQTLRKTIALAKRHGAREIILAGLSNGASGASGLINKFPPSTFYRLILISGLTPRATPPKTKVLAICGNNDAPYRRIKRWSTHRRVTLRTLNGGHFIFLSEYPAVKRLIREYLKLPKGR